MSSRAPIVNLRAYRPRHEATKVLTRRFCEDHALVPVNAIGSSLVIAMANPDDETTVEAVAMMTGLRIEVVRATASEISDTIVACYGESN